MSVLPPWVIEDSTASPLQCLTPTGWVDCAIGAGATRVSSRGQALSFYGEADALAWILEAQRNTPALFRGRTAVAIERPHKPANFGGDFSVGLVRHDYDPYAGAV